MEPAKAIDGEVEAPKKNGRKSAAVIPIGNPLKDMVSQAMATGNMEIVERVLAVQERMEAQKNEREANVDMVKTHKAMRPIAADAENKQTKSRYATYHALDKVLRPIYTDNNFVLTFNTPPGAAENYVRVTCDLLHISGHSRHYQIDMPADGKGAKGGDVMTKTHAMGSAVSYGMRYLLKMIFNIAVGEADDDGNKAGDVAAKPAERITADQLAELTGILKKSGAAAANAQIILQHWKIEELSDLTPAQHVGTLKQLKKKFGG